MNRFRTKKKSKEEPSVGIARSSTDEQHSFMGFRRGKKSQEEEKKELDLSTALPSSDDFRTSLLMTGLSARFSMLREQDDPNSKIGKASDDSVLFPKRQSKLMELGFNDLDDIAEVESLRAPPPFMRTNSFSSDTGSTSGSVLTRARPTEGNNLFGGRQKIYRINTATTSSKNVAEGGMGGRALYENDVALSAFQKLRLKEKEDRFLGDEDDNDEDNSTGASKEASGRLTSFPRSDSPSPVDFNLRRETSSTTSSVGRNSTAATSVASQPAVTSKDWHTSSQTQPSLSNATGSAASSGPTIERTITTRTRRLYEQGLNQDLHEHQSSALSRFDTLTGKRPLGTKLSETLTSSATSPAITFGRDRFGPPSGTVASALERLDRQARPKTTSPKILSPSPPVAGGATSAPATTAQESNILNAPSGNLAEAKSAAQSSPPLGSPTNELSEQQGFSIQPNDLGKATALGMFQKPTLPYDESRFAQRQLQRQQGRETPTERIMAEFDEFHSAGRSSPSSSTTRQPERTTPLPPTAEKTASLPSTDSVVAARKTFLFDDDDDDNASLSFSVQQLPRNTAEPQAVRERPSDADHPAFRQAVTPALYIHDDTSGEENGVPQQARPATSNGAEESSKDGPVDSPTLGPGGPGLTGMVLQHLRSTSNASSVYSVESSHAPASRGNAHATANPWEDDNWTTSVYSTLDGDHSEQTTPTVQDDKHPPAFTARPSIPDTYRTAMAADPAGNASKPPSVRSVSSRSRLPIASVTGSARSSHNLDDDVDDFANQLASARKRVQERLTTYVESDSSRNTSPLLAPTEPHTLPLLPKTNPLGILRAKSSRGSLMERPREVSQPKTFKIPGLGSSTNSAQASPAKPTFEDSSSSAHPTLIPAVPAAAPPPAVPTARKVSEPLATPEEREERFATPKSSPPRSSTDTGHNGSGAEADGELPNAAVAGVHPGLQAFRNARRQLQKQKVLDMQARRPGSAPRDDESSTDQQAPPVQERRGTVSRERGPPPVYYQRRDRSQESSGGRSRSRSNSRTSAQAGRDRSESEGSNGGGYTRNVPPRLRPSHATGPPQDEYQPSGGHLGPPRGNMPGARSPGIPGLPGTDIRRSPHMPPTGIPGSGPSLSVQTAMARRSPAGGGYGPSASQPSPISPLGSAGLSATPYYPGSANASGPSTPTAVGGGPRTPYGPGSSMPSNNTKKQVNKNDISEPTFVTSTSRVPTMSLPSGDYTLGAAGEGGSRSRSGSRARAGSNAAASGIVPPLPPINPMRKQPTSRGPRGIFNGMLGRRGDGGEGGELASTASTPNLALATAVSSSPGYYQGSPINSEPPRTLRRQASEATGMRTRAAGAGSDPRMDMSGGMI